jgi:heptaprenyl diphosphate synthase
MAEGIYNLPVLRSLDGPGGERLRSLLGGPLDAEAQARALALVREGDGVAQSITEARAYVDRAVADLDRLPATPARDALAAASRHLLVGLDR